MKELNRHTLILADTQNYGQAVHSLKNSLSKVKFARAIFFTDIDYNPDFEGLEVIKIPTLKSKDDYSKFIFYELYKYIETEYILITQWDGTIEDPEAWDDEFYDYDVVSPAWLYSDGRNCGCGGISSRTRRVMEVTGTDPIIQVSSPEDAALGRLYRRYLEETYDIKFAPDEVCDRFGFELRAPIQPVFGKHGFFHTSHKPWVVIRRQGAFGDIVALEPLLEYFHSKKYNIVLDTLPQFYDLFSQHYFKVHQPKEVDPRVLDNAKVYDLNMAYEVTPKQNHLKSYFEICGIKDYKLKNPKLSLFHDPKSKDFKLFKKYAIIHNDRRDPKQGRNVVTNWKRIVDLLKSEGYDVIHLGMGEKAHCGAIEMLTPTNPFLLWVVGGADLFVGIDSGIANASVAMGVPAIIFFGSVTPEHIYPDLTNIKVIQHEKKCDTPKCWSSRISTEGVACVVDENIPPCTIFSQELVVKKIQEVINPI